MQAKIVEAHATLAAWFDRAATEATADVDGVARLVTSRSGLKLTGTETLSKEVIKRSLLVQAINQIEAQQQAFSESEDGKKLKRMLAYLKNNSRL